MLHFVHLYFPWIVAPNTLSIIDPNNPDIVPINIILIGDISPILSIIAVMLINKAPKNEITIPIMVIPPEIPGETILLKLVNILVGPLLIIPISVASVSAKEVAIVPMKAAANIFPPNMFSRITMDDAIKPLDITCVHLLIPCSLFELRIDALYSRLCFVKINAVKVKIITKNSQFIPPPNTNINPITIDDIDPLLSKDLLIYPINEKIITINIFIKS